MNTTNHIDSYIRLCRRRDPLILFILRRAFLGFPVTRRDVIEASRSSISEATASRKLNDALRKFPNHLERAGKKIVSKPLAETPPEVGTQMLMHHLDSGDPIDLGLLPGEVFISQQKFHQCNEVPDKVPQKLIYALRERLTCEIVYLGLRKGESHRRRKLFPLGLEKIGDQWRLIAQDLESEQPVEKNYVLSRIFNVELKGKYRSNLSLSHKDTLITCKPRLNNEFNKEQQDMIAREIGIADDGTLRIPSRSIFDFKRRYLETEPSGVWPPIVDLREEL